MEPQQVLIHTAQTGKRHHEDVDHPGKRLEIGGVPLSVVLREKRAIPETVVEYCFIWVGRPKPKIRQPQSFYCSHRVSEHDQRIELQMFKNRCRLFVHISKTLYQ